MVGGWQLQGTWKVFCGPVKTRSALAGQVVLGTKTVTFVVWFAGMAPSGGVKVMPLIPLLDEDQLRLRRLSRLVNVAVQFQP